MRRLWIFVLGVLGLATTICSGFTVERSNLGTFGSRNWSMPVFHLDRRNSVEKIFSDDFQSSDIENILREPEMRKFVKLPAKKCSSEDPSQRLKRSEDFFDSANNSPTIKKNVSELREKGIEPFYSEIKNAAPSVVTSPGKLKSSGPSIATSPKETRIPESTIVASSKKTNESETSIFSSPKESKTSTWTSGFVSTSKEIESSKLPIEGIPNEPKTPDATSEKSADSQTLKNVVFLLIDDSTARLPYFKFFQTAIQFAVYGFLQNCYNAEFPAVFPLGDSLVSRKEEENCECDHFLRTNIASLLAWGRRKEMTTGTVSSTNFSIPLPFGYESPANQLAKEFEDNEEVKGFHEEISRSKSESNDVWRLIDIEKQTTSDKRSSPTADSAIPTVGSLSKHEAVNGFDGMWNVLDMLSRIRIAFFRILLESLGNMAGTEEGLNGKKTLPLQPSFVEIMLDAIREFKAVQNDNGFILVVAAPRNSWSEAIDVLQREMLTKETLLVVSGVCSPTERRAPFFAHGPGVKVLQDARTIWDLPELVQRAMADGCLEKNCQKLRPKKPVALLPSIELASLPSEPPRKRFGRATHKAEMNETTFSNATSTKKPVEDLKKDKEMTPEIGKRSGGSDVRMDNVAKVLGIVTSILTMLALNPS